MTASATVRITKNNLPNLLAAVKRLTSQELLVGVPAETAHRDIEGGDRGDVSNAVIGYLQEFGGVIDHPGGTRFIRDAIVLDKNGKNPRAVGTRFVGPNFEGEAEVTAAHSVTIPARPFLIPGVTAAIPRAVEKLRLAGSSALTGDEAAVDRGFGQAGLICQNAVRERINSNIQPALSEYTLKMRRARGVTRTNTLVDTGQLRNSITYVIRPR